MLLHAKESDFLKFDKLRRGGVCLTCTFFSDGIFPADIRQFHRGGHNGSMKKRNEEQSRLDAAIRKFDDVQEQSQALIKDILSGGATKETKKRTREFSAQMKANIAEMKAARKALEESRRAFALTFQKSLNPNKT